MAADLDALKVFDATCAHAPATSESFAALAKATGLQFLGADSRRSEAETEHTWRDVVYWGVDPRRHSLSVSMGIFGSAEHHRSSCIVRAPADPSLTAEALVAHVRAAMNLGEPTAVDPAGPAHPGARWDVGAGIIGVALEPSDSGPWISIAVIKVM